MMKRRTLFSCAALSICCVAFAGTAIAATKSSIVKPAPGAISVKIRAGKKTLTYYSATTVSPLEYRVRGPLPIRIFTRCTYASPSDAKTTIYRVAVTVDESPLTSRSLRSLVSKKVKGEAGAPLGAMRKILVRVPVGEHVIRIAPVDPNPILVRVLAGTGKKAHAKLVPYQPESYVKAVRLLDRDLETTVYRFTPTQPVTLSLHGPVPLRLTTRLDFGTTNGVTQSYLIKVEMDGKPLKAFALKSAASHTATYPDLGEITPGRGRSVDFKVPRGMHHISIALAGTTAEGASARIEIPQRESKAGAQ
jgi:hypothetical protein